jgi:hypothetical protein
VLALVLLTTVLVGVAGAAPKARREPALVTISGSSASLVEEGDAARLDVTGVAPEAVFDSKSGPETEISTFGAVRLLDTRTAYAVVRAAPTGTGDAETEGLALSNFRYDPRSATLSADAAPVPDASGLPLLEDAPAADAGGQPAAAPVEDTVAADADGQLPAGPVEVVALDTDTRVAASGAPAPPRGAAESSYTIDLKVTYDGFIHCGIGGGCYSFSGKLVAADSKCTKMGDWSFATSEEPVTIYQTKITIVTTPSCFFDPAVAKIRLQKSQPSGSLGTADLTVTQVGPRYFLSTCNDAPPHFDTSCRVFFAPAFPIVDLNVR